MERPRPPRTLLLAAALALGGCSLTLSGPAADRPRDRLPICDTTKTLVGVDAVIGSLLGLGTLIALGEDAGAAALLPGAASAGFILAAVSGNRKVNDCRAAVAEYEEPMLPSPLARLAGRRAPAAPPPMQPALAPGAFGGGPAQPAPAAPAPSRRRPVQPAPAGPGTVRPPAGAPPVQSGPPPVQPAPPAAPVQPAPPAPVPPAAPVQPAPPAPPAPAPGAAPPASDPWIDFWRELP